jgi:hypothetical protein
MEPVSGYSAPSLIALPEDEDEVDFAEPEHAVKDAANITIAVRTASNFFIFKLPFQIFITRTTVSPRDSAI